jgi:hypothetical protein
MNKFPRPCLKESCRTSFPAANLQGMAGIGKNFDSLRLNRFENERLILALLISLALHLAGFGGYELDRYFGWSQRLHWWHHAAKVKTELLPPLAQNSEPQIFVEVNPDQAATEAPQNAKYYSSKNSRAANPDADRDADTPKLSGKQTDVPMTEDVSHPQFSKSQSDVNPQQAEEQQENSEAKPALSAGDLTFGNPNDLQQERPRTLNQAYAMMANRMPSVMTKQDGGVNRHAAAPAYDVKLTGFGEYDQHFYEAVVQRWFGLLDSQKFAQDRIGKVTLLFHLNYDGSISDMRFAENTVGDLLGYVCQKAVLDNVPYERFPSDMRLKLGDYADIQFTFLFYNN